MIVYSYSEAQHKFSSILDAAKKEGKVLIRKKDGSLFSISPEKPGRSPLDVKGIKTNVKTSDIIEAVRESRQSR